MSSSFRLYNNQVNITQGHGLILMSCITEVDNFLGYVHVILSSLCTLCCLLSVKKEKHDLEHFFFHSLYDKTFVRFGVCDIQNLIQVLVRFISLSLHLGLITPTDVPQP